jgi:hypothetical protein
VAVVTGTTSQIVVIDIDKNHPQPNPAATQPERASEPAGGADGEVNMGAPA